MTYFEIIKRFEENSDSEKAIDWKFVFAMWQEDWKTAVNASI